VIAINGLHESPLKPLQGNGISFYTLTKSLQKGAKVDTVRADQTTMITVRHACANGWHEFTCAQVPGFHLISEEADLERAYTQVPEAIAEIVEADEGAAVTVTIADTYSDYVANLPEGMRPSESHYSIKRVA
jgi:hypothetical protein